MNSCITFQRPFALAYGARAIKPSRRLKAGLTPMDSYDAYDAYDSRIERQAAIDDEKKVIASSAIMRLTVNDVKIAVKDAEAGCIVGESSQEGCAVLWDVVDEVWSAYTRQVEKDIEEAKKQVDGTEWSLKRRVYDL